jgi:hypothetical protein
MSDVMTSAEEYRSKLGGFDKLTTINYPQWSSIIEFILKSHNAWEIVQGNEAQPPVGNTAAARALTADYNKRSGEAAAAIRLSCSHDVATYLQGVTDPHLMWTILHDEFNHARHTIGRTTLLAAFHGSRPKEGHPISVYFGRLRQFQKQLIGTPEAITDQMLKTHIFTTLPDVFEVQKQILELQPEAGVTVQTVMDAMKNLEMRRAEANRLRLDKQDASVAESNTAGTSAAALQASATTDKAQRCSFCRKTGHHYNNCFRRRKRNRASEDSAEAIKCYYCGEEGHIRRNCPVSQKAKKVRFGEGPGPSELSTSTAPGKKISNGSATATASLAIGESDDLEPY